MRNPSSYVFQWILCFIYTYWISTHSIHKISSGIVALVRKASKVLKHGCVCVRIVFVCVHCYVCKQWNAKKDSFVFICQLTFYRVFISLFRFMVYWQIGSLVTLNLLKVELLWKRKFWLGLRCTLCSFVKYFEMLNSYSKP